MWRLRTCRIAGRSGELLSQASVGQALSALPGFQEDGEPVEQAHQAEFEQ